jgi:hypothetical protein
MNASFTRASLSGVHSRIDEIADQAGVEGVARLSVDDTLAALPFQGHSDEEPAKTTVSAERGAGRHAVTRAKKS